MNIEQIEHFIVESNNKRVIVVQPGFGNQSDSFEGIVNTLGNIEHSIGFQLTAISGGGWAKLFTATDVKTIETATESSVMVIRLKGPHDYQQIYANNP